MAPTGIAASVGVVPAAAKPSGLSATTATSSDDTIFGIPKWALAVAAGGVVALGLAYYVLSAPDDTSAKAGKRKKEKSTKNKTPSGSKTNSTTATPSKEKEKDQLKEENKVTIEDVGEDEDMVGKIFNMLSFY